MPAQAEKTDASVKGGLSAAVRRTRPIYRVFVSSTWTDLQPERRALMEALNRMEEMRFVGMEFFGNRPDDTHDASIDQVDLCEVLVGIIGHRYGSGITEAEYRRARELGLPCFVYFKREDTSRPDLTDGDAALAAKLATFKQDLLRGHTVKEFTSAEELAANATADLHNWVAARWISVERDAPVGSRAPVTPPPDADRTNTLRLLERIQHDWIEGVLEASLHHRAWLDLGLDWKEDAVEHPWDRIVVAPSRPIQTLSAEDSITGVFDSAQHTLLVLGEPGAGKTTTLLELARDLIARARGSALEPAPVVLALSTWTGEQRDFADWIVTELGLRYQVPKKLARGWLDDARLVLLLDGLDEVGEERRAACVESINAFSDSLHPPGLAVTCRVAEYDALSVKLRLRAAICLQPLTPEQVERYFAAAGTGLDPLRQAMRQDAGLRELARTPLMLSVMTMAWRDGPVADLTSSLRDTAEARRQQLFEAYVHAATHRRGKAMGAYTPEQTVHWLAWLARRMKMHDNTLFAVEQLQPAWLGGWGEQFRYFLGTRLLGAATLVLPFLLWKSPLLAKLLLLAASGLIGGYVGLIDFGFARWAWGGTNRAVSRLGCLVVSFVVGSIGWNATISVFNPEHGNAGELVKILPSIYWFVTAFAFCVALDVRALDVKPAASMNWSWRKAFGRALTGLVGMNASVTGVFVIVLGIAVYHEGWAAAKREFVGDGTLLWSLAITGTIAALTWARLRPRLSFHNAALACTLAIFGAEVLLATRSPRGSFPWVALPLQLFPATLIGVLGGFASTMIDPSRGRNAGVWFWLRVPVTMFFFVWVLALLPGMVTIYSAADLAGKHVTVSQIGIVLALGAACGLAAFFRFGGFNGVQHLVLRWLLVRSGDLPARAEAFFNHTAQLALMQKVGFGYRFIHKLLLDHLAERAPEEKGNSEISARVSLRPRRFFRGNTR